MHNYLRQFVYQSKVQNFNCVVYLPFKENELWELEWIKQQQC